MLITNLTFGGAQRVFQDHNRLLSTKFEVREAVFNLADGQAFDSPRPVIDLGVAGGGNLLGRIGHFIRRVCRFSAIKRQVRPSLCISHLEGADYVNILARDGGKRLLCVHGSKLHDSNIHGAFGAIRKRLLIPLLYNRADRIVTVSRGIAIELEQLGVRPAKLITIHNFFDTAAIRARSLEPLSADESAIFAGPPVLVTSGRLTLQKNQAGLIALFAKLLKRRPARLLLIGDGELRQPLVDQARALGLSVGEGPVGGHDVVFAGFQDNPFRLQRHARLFLLTSGCEGFPMVLGEAMACGLPIVSADCPTGPREFLAPDTIGHAVCPLRVVEAGDFGMLMPIPGVGDQATIDPWVETLDRLLNNPDERKRLAALSLARAEDFSRDTIGPQWLALIDELLGARPATPA